MVNDSRPLLLEEPHAAAQAAGLHYVSDSLPGIRRRRSGRGFRYGDPGGGAVRDPETLERIRSLAIPPAYRGVWICPDPLGHLQATGFDDRGRKQYRYHPLWRAVRDETKYGHMVRFAHALPAIRARVSADLSSPRLSRAKVLAAVVQLLERTRIRIGNEEYCRENDSYGLTTLCNEHLEVEANTLHFHFRAKSGKLWTTDLCDRRLARLVRRVRDLPGRALFQYVDGDGRAHAVTSSDVNGYLHEAAGAAFTAKDFRTWAGTVMAACGLRARGLARSPTEAKRNVCAVVRSVAGALGNTPAVCRKSYVDPAVVEGYLDGSLIEFMDRETSGDARTDRPALRPDETAVLRYLESVKR